MDSFFSLFDPSDGQASKQTNKKRHKPETQDQDSVKKKTDAPKGRRRGRKCQGKQDPLPEESSFLCEPQLSGELLVTGNYIDNYIALPQEDPKPESDDKPKRRNSGRKNRRKKNKISPAKELNDASNTAWSQPLTSIETDVKLPSNLNNQQTKVKNGDVNIGKNVNDLTDYKKSRRKNSIDPYEEARRGFEKKAVYNVIDKLEKVGLKDDMYLAGDFNTEDLENDYFYSSDDFEDNFDDTNSELDDSGDECYGSLPPEPRFGNVEYKLQLVQPCEKRFQHLVTQLKWRLVSGGGCCVYVVGVRDCGALRGLRASALRASLHTLTRMARALDATLAHVTARRVKQHRAVAEVYIRKLADTQQSVELRVAVLGANEAGKSTIIGVLTQGELDNGRGSARLNMFRHLHEVKSGRTSSLSHEILGFDAQGNVVNYGCSELMTAERIGERSAKLVSFLDLAGHTKYQRTTLHGLSGYCPHYAMLVISATAGLTSITEEHLALLVALDLPFFAVITKSELAPAAVPHLVHSLGRALHAHRKKPLLITDENAARSCVVSKKLILDNIDPEEDKENDDDIEEVPVFPVSCVRGRGLNALHAYLLALQPPHQPTSQPTQMETIEFQIDEVFHVGDSSGPVVGGLLARGQLYEGDDLIIGPLETGEFVGVRVTSVYRNRAPHQWAVAGQAASLQLCPRGPLRPRAGMVLLSAPPVGPHTSPPVFTETGHVCRHSAQDGDQHIKLNDFLQGTDIKISLCVTPCIKRLVIEPPLRPRAGMVLLSTPPVPVFTEMGHICRHSAQISDILQQKPNHENTKNRKNIRRKNKNLLQDLAKVEKNLLKDESIENNNTYHNPECEKDSIIKDIVLEKDNNIYKSVEDKDGNSNVLLKDGMSEEDGDMKKHGLERDGECTCRDQVLLEDPNNPRGCIYFQATVHVLRHPTAIYPGFQCTVHVGNVRQTAIIEGILSHGSEVRAGEAASVVFRFLRCPEYLVRGRRLLLTAGLATRAIGRITQIFPYVP